jgi:serine protease Do
MKRYTSLVAITLVLTLTLAGCSLGRSLAGPAPAAVPTATLAPAPATTTTDTASPSALAALQGVLENIYPQVNPSVVSIRVVQTQQVPAPQGPQQYSLQAQGSGFVWDKQGRIITNNHVVAGATDISVAFSDGTTASAKVVGTDPDSDLAVVQVDVPADELHPVVLADSTQVKVGQLAIAIGNPFGKEGTMTLGIVSAIGRELPVNDGAYQGPSYTIPDVIQTDAPINPGNSGGVLVDDQGRVIGVTAAIESPVGANAGIGFAIPSAIVQKVIPTLIETGKYAHPWLGISGTTLQPDLAKAMDLKSDQHGALVVEVVPNSPADKANLHGSDSTVTIQGQQIPVGGDVILAVDGKAVNTFDDLVTYLARNTEVGQTISLTVLRQGQKQTVKVTLEARPTSQPQQAQAVPSPQAATGAYLGVQGVTVTPEVAQAMGLAQNQAGVLVERVELGSPADEAGLHGSFKSTTIQGQQIAVGGDIITAVNGQPVMQLEDLTAFIQLAQPGQTVTLTLLRAGKQIDVQVTLAEQPTTISD